MRLGRSSTDICAVGDGGTLLHFDGTTRSSMTTVAATLNLSDILGGGDVFAVGQLGTIWKLASP